MSGVSATNGSRYECNGPLNGSWYARCAGPQRRNHPLSCTRRPEVESLHSAGRELKSSTQVHPLASFGVIRVIIIASHRYE
jgi:hypothetical protein